jgi:hypothetical protein
MPHIRLALAVRASARDAWPAPRNDGASPASGRLHLRPSLGQKPVGQRGSQTERILSLRHVRHDRGPLEMTRMPREARGDVSGQPMVYSPPVTMLHALPPMRACGQDQRRCDQGGMLLASMVFHVVCHDHSRLGEGSRRRRRDGLPPPGLVTAAVWRPTRAASRGPWTGGYPL